MQKIDEKVSVLAPEKLAELKRTALAIKKEIIMLGAQATEGHCASGLSMTDLLTVLYFHTMHVDPRNPKDPARDRFVLSKGHGSIGLYCALYQRGYFDREKLYIHSLSPARVLAVIPCTAARRAVELSTGSLGHGISMAVGMALAARMEHRQHRVFALVGDGESNEGIVWEAAALARPPQARQPYLRARP